MWNLFTVGSLQFCNDSTIASLEANQNRPKIKCYINKSIKFLYFVYIKINYNSNSGFVLKHQNCINQVGRGLGIFCFGLNTELLKDIYKDGSRIHATSETLLSVGLVKRLKALIKSSREPQLRCCWVRKWASDHLQ